VLIAVGWLREYVDVPPDIPALAERLTLAGMEVERIQEPFVDVVVAEVAGLRPHPNATKLQLARVKTGDASVEVVTGATNLSVGDRVPLARAGARLGSRIIGAEVFRGVRSEGMLCSAIELGLGEDGDGILILDAKAPLGADLRTVFPIGPVLDIEIKSNRPDLLAHLGIAREIAALYATALRPPAARPARVPSTGSVSITIEDAEGCRRFVGRLMRGIKIGPSPGWMQARLRAAGVRPISNVVDITNYVMLESGQPMHAFDYDRLAGGRLVVRRARPGETLACLDGKTRELTPDYLVVADAERAQALAGIIGGTESAVQAGTTTVLLEAATWEPRRIRATSRALGLRSEASARFERGLSPALSQPAVDRAAALLAEIASGSDVQAVDVYPVPLVQPAIAVRSAELDRILGVGIPKPQATAILERLEFAVKPTADGLRATPPAFRLDCSIPEDIAEEVGRIYGYDRVPSTLPGERRPVTEVYQVSQEDDRAKEFLAGLGFDETITYSFADAHTAALIRLPTAPADPLTVRNPILERRDTLRVSLLPGLLSNLAQNARQDQPDTRLFELATAFWGRAGDAWPEEPRLLAVAAHVGSGHPDAGAQALRRLEAGLRLLRERIGRQPLAVRQAVVPGFHQGRSGEILREGAVIGAVGEIHPGVLTTLELPGRAVAAEVLFDPFIEYGLAVPQASPLVRFPGIRRDLTVIVPRQTAGNALAQVMREHGGSTLREIAMLSEYEGPQLPWGTRSISFRLMYQAADRTLTAAEVSERHEAVITALRQRFGADVRA
jgi:phenylalanyl-tRNA synthetase beta chain